MGLDLHRDVATVRLLCFVEDFAVLESKLRFFAAMLSAA
jgi:hypothetical protein